MYGSVYPPAVVPPRQPPPTQEVRFGCGYGRHTAGLAPATQAPPGVAAGGPCGRCRVCRRGSGSHKLPVSRRCSRPQWPVTASVRLPRRIAGGVPGKPRASVVRRRRWSQLSGLEAPGAARRRRAPHTCLTRETTYRAGIGGAGRPLIVPGPYTAARCERQAYNCTNSREPVVQWRTDHWDGGTGKPV